MKGKSNLQNKDLEDVNEDDTPEENPATKIKFNAFNTTRDVTLPENILPSEKESRQGPEYQEVNACDLGGCRTVAVKVHRTPSGPLVSFLSRRNVLAFVHVCIHVCSMAGVQAFVWCVCLYVL